MLRVEGLYKSFNSVPVVRDVSFTVEPSETIFLTGPSGSGKSTILRVLANLIPFDAGIITFDDKTPEQFGFTAWRREVLYVSQHRINRVGSPMDLYKVICGFRTRRDRPEDCEYFVSLCEDMGLDSGHTRQNWSELSGGESQRANLAVCLATRPSVLLLDEPSASCDERSTRLVEKTLMNCPSSKLWVSHEVEQVDRVPGKVHALA